VLSARYSDHIAGCDGDLFALRLACFSMGKTNGGEAAKTLTNVRFIGRAEVKLTVRSGSNADSGICSDKPQRLHARASLAADDDMVVDGDAHVAAGVDQVAGEADVLAAG
jgi:hypothetical protein